MSLSASAFGAASGHLTGIRVWVVVNRDLAEIAAIVTAERLRRIRQIGPAEFVNRLRGG
jgi:hypothetical protein